MLPPKTGSARLRASGMRFVGEFVEAFAEEITSVASEGTVPLNRASTTSPLPRSTVTSPGVTDTLREPAFPSFA